MCGTNAVILVFFLETTVCWCVVLNQPVLICVINNNFNKSVQSAVCESRSGNVCNSWGLLRLFRTNFHCILALKACFWCTCVVVFELHFLPVFWPKRSNSERWVHLMIAAFDNDCHNKGNLKNGFGHMMAPFKTVTTYDSNRQALLMS